MCKFFMLDIFEYLRPYAYYLRCDTDCFVESLGRDIFSWAEQEDVHYGWVIKKLELHGPTKATFPPWVKRYTESCAIEPSGGHLVT